MLISLIEVIKKMLKEHQAGLYSMHCSASQTEFEGKEKILIFLAVSYFMLRLRIFALNFK